MTQSESDSWNKISIAKKTCNEYGKRSDQSFSNRRNSTNLLTYQIPRCNDREITPMQRADTCIRYKLLRHQRNSFVRTSLFLALKIPSRSSTSRAETSPSPSPVLAVSPRPPQVTWRNDPDEKQSSILSETARHIPPTFLASFLNHADTSSEKYT